MKVLVFDISSDYAHFRQPYSTTSSLTYAIPPRTAIFGLIGAVLGVDSGGFGQSHHFEVLENAGLRTGVRILSSIKKVRFNMNYTYTKSDVATKKVLHIQVPVEVIKDPVYRVYVSGDEWLLTELASMIRNKECYYTPYLGVSEFIATVKYVGFVDATISPDKAKINSAIYLLEGTKLALENGLKIFRETHAISMNAFRHVTKYLEVAYEMDGKSVPVDAVDNDSVVVTLTISGQSETVMMI